jgi:tRNA (guanine6-N2)-methyltransferase
VDSVQQQFFARISAGLEQVAWQDIERRLAVEFAGFGHRRIDFGYAGAPSALLDLRSIDDVYVFVARLTRLDHTRTSLDRLTQKIALVDFDPALAVVAAARGLPEYPKYRVTASHLGKRNYSRYDVEGAVERALTPRLPWRFVLNEADEPEPDLDLRVLLEDDWALLGLRLGMAPLHRRDYKVASRTGSLKAPVAYCLGLLAGLAPGQVLLDPACGAGTILAEGLSLAVGGVLIGGDVEQASLDLAQHNLRAAGAPVRTIGATTTLDPRAEPPGVLLYHGDARAIPVALGSVDTVVSNLPWGQQVPIDADIAQLYAGILGAIAHVLAPGSQAALLTDQAEAMRAALAAHPALRLVSSLPISLFGRHPIVYVLENMAD